MFNKKVVSKKGEGVTTNGKNYFQSRGSWNVMIWEGPQKKRGDPKHREKGNGLDQQYRLTIRRDHAGGGLSQTKGLG